MSPLPWKINDGPTGAIVLDVDDKPVLYHCAIDDAKFLVQAANAHGALVLMLRDVLDAYDIGGFVDMEPVRAMIAVISPKGFVP